MNNTREKSTNGFYDITKTWFEADHNDSKEDNITVDEGSGGQVRVKFNLQDQTIDNIDNQGTGEDGYLVHPVDLNLQTQIHMGSTKVNNAVPSSSEPSQDYNDPGQAIQDSNQLIPEDNMGEDNISTTDTFVDFGGASSMQIGRASCRERV